MLSLAQVWGGISYADMPTGCVCIHVSEMAGKEQYLQAQASLANQPGGEVEFFFKFGEKIRN